MANKEHLKIIEKGKDEWNLWREQNPNILPDLSEADFADADLSDFDFDDANLSRANFDDALLCDVSFWGANLVDASLFHANLCYASFRGADLIRADLGRADLNTAELLGVNLFESSLSHAQLQFATIIDADLTRTNLEMADFAHTIFGNVNLGESIGLDCCIFNGPCTVDHRTLGRSMNVPINFWRGCGLPDALIDYIPSLLNQAFVFYSCFISYSSRDQEFAYRLHADLQNAGVRCWFAPHDLPIGAKTWDGIDQAIRTRDKVLLILSEGALASDWVEDEVTTAFAEERRRKELVLFPVRLDDAVMESPEPWAGKLRDNRNIGDFTGWKDHDVYKKTFDRIVRDLKRGG